MPSEESQEGPSICINAAVDSWIGRELREMNENKARLLNILHSTSERCPPNEPVSMLLTGYLRLSHQMLRICFPQPLKYLSISELKSSHCTMTGSAISPDYVALPLGVPPRQAAPGYCTRGVLRGTCRPPLCRQVSHTFLCQDTALTLRSMCWAWGPIPTAELEAKCDEATVTLHQYPEIPKLASR